MLGADGFLKAAVKTWVNSYSKQEKKKKMSKKMVVDWQAMCPEFSISHKAILSPRDFIYTVKYEIGDFMSSGELNVNSNTPVGKPNLVNSFECPRHS